MTLPSAFRDQIPFPDESKAREASAPIPCSIPGSAEYMCSQGSYDDGTQHVLPAGKGQLEWAIYRLPTNGYSAVSIEVNLAISGGKAYCATANYNRMCWEFYPQLTEPEFDETVAAYHISPQDRVYIAVAAYDAATVAVLDSRIVLDQPGWETCTIAEEVTEPTGLQVFAAGPGGEPRVATLDELNTKLYSSSELQPLDSGDWQSVIAGRAGELDQLWRPLRAGWIGGRPAMAYYRYGADYQLCYTCGTIAEPAEDDWVTAHVGDTPFYSGIDLGLAELDGKPRLLYRHSDTDAVWLASATTGTPYSDDWIITKVRDSAIRPSLAVVNGRLACTYFAGPISSLMLSYARATVDSPSGPSSWVEAEICGSLYGNFYCMTELVATPLDSMEAPVIAQLFDNAMVPWISSANVAEPSTFAHWDNSTVDHDVEIGGFRMEMKRVLDRPALVYYANNLLRLQYAHSVTANPESADDWQITTVVSGVDAGCVALAEINGQPAVAYFDRDELALVYMYCTEE
jgi:hypothetical protein